MFRLAKSFSFEAAHQLTEHDGKCSRLHGHSWKGTIVCSGGSLHNSGPKQGMLIDYGDMKKAIEPIIETKLDHYFLNETLYPIVPTSENIAQWLYRELKPVLPLLEMIIIEETCTSRCEYFE